MKIPFIAAIGLVLSLLVSSAARAAVGDTRIMAGGPMAVISDNVFWGPSLTVSHEITPQIELAGETGFYYLSRSVYSISASAWVIPVLPTAYYRLNPVSSAFAPFVGLGLGVGIVHGNLSFEDSTYSATEARFQGVAHVGARIGAQQKFFADFKVGVLSDVFYFAPTLGWTF